MREGPPTLGSSARSSEVCEKAITAFFAATDAPAETANTEIENGLLAATFEDRSRRALALAVTTQIYVLS